MPVPCHPSIDISSLLRFLESSDLLGCNLVPFDHQLSIIHEATTAWKI